MDGASEFMIFWRIMLPLGLTQLRGALYTEWNMVMAGTAISVIPTIIISIIGQRYFQRSIAITGIK